MAVAIGEPQRGWRRTISTLLNPGSDPERDLPGCGVRPGQETGDHLHKLRAELRRAVDRRGCHTNDDFNNECRALASPGNSPPTMDQLRNRQHRRHRHHLFNAAYQVWDAFGNGSKSAILRLWTTIIPSHDQLVHQRGHDREHDRPAFHSRGKLVSDFNTRMVEPRISCIHTLCPERSLPSLACVLSLRVSTSQQGGIVRQSVFGLVVTATEMTQPATLADPVTPSLRPNHGHEPAINTHYEHDAVVPNGTFVPIPFAVRSAASFNCAFQQPPPDRTPQIVFNGRNVANKSVRVIVGEQINLTCLSSGGSGITNFSWSVGGTVANVFRR